MKKPPRIGRATYSIASRWPRRDGALGRPIDRVNRCNGLRIIADSSSAATFAGAEIRQLHPLRRGGASIPQARTALFATADCGRKTAPA
jgi:hypothetical protein